jgi:hypothetical protein
MGCRVLLAKPEVKKQLGRPKCTPVDNIKMELKAVGWISMSWIHLTQDMDKRQAVVNTVMKLWFP